MEVFSMEAKLIAKDITVVTALMLTMMIDANLYSKIQPASKAWVFQSLTSREPLKPMRRQA